MRSETLIHQHPPTPPITGTEYQSGLSHIARYNADGSYSFGEVGYGSPGSPIHEGIPSRVSRVDSHSGNSIGLGLQYVRKPGPPARIMMLTSLQDGYGPPSEYYQNGQFNGMPVSNFLYVA